MTSGTRYSVVALALAGVGFAASSTWVHYRLLTDPSYVSPCDINATFSCAQAYLSRFGSVFGVPVAIGGVAWFALVALIAALAPPAARGSSNPAASYVFVLATIALAGVLKLAYASYVVLKVVCLLCLGTYICVLGIFVVSAMAMSFPIVRVPRRFLGDLRSLAMRPLLLVIAVLYFGSVAAAVAIFPREARMQTPTQAAEATALPQDAQTQFAAAWAQQPRAALGIPSAGAKVVIVKFNDWQCPMCKYLHYQYKAIKAKVKEMLGITDFDKEYALKLPAIRQDVADGMALKITGTPAYFLNGVNTSSNGFLPPAYLEMAIKIEMKK